MTSLDHGSNAPALREDSTIGVTEPPCAAANRKWVLIATVLGSAMAFMDGSVVNVALPELQSKFSANASEVQWVVQSYALFSSVLLLLGGAIGDLYGRRRTFTWGVALFTLASAGCAASLTLSELVVARSIQGIGAALLVPQALSILSGAYPDETRAKAIGIWSAWTSVFVALGPVAGGWLMQVWSWRLIFLLNLPFAMLVFILTPKIPESRAVTSGPPKRLDKVGAILNTASFAAIIYAISFATQLGWHDPRIAASLGIGILLLAAFLVSQAKGSNAMMPLALFAIPRFSAANLLTFLLYGALGGALYVVPFYLIQVRHYSPAQAGGAFIPLIVLMFLFSSRVGALTPRIGEKLLLITGSALAAAGFVTFALLDKFPNYTSAILPGVLVLGAGMTLVVAPLTTAAMSSVPVEMTGMASAINNTVSRVAALLSVSLIALVLSHAFEVSLGRRLGASTLPVDARQKLIAQESRLLSTPIPEGLDTAGRVTAEDILDQSFLDGFQWVMVTCAASAGAGSIAVLVLMRRRAAG